MIENRYMRNQYTSIFKTSREYIINTNEKTMIRLPFSKEEGIFYIMNSNIFTLDKLTEYFTHKEINKLCKYKTIIKYTEEKNDKGFLSRQEGFFSLITSDYVSYEKKIEESNILLLGAGAIGTHVYWNLLSIGVKNITIVDYDVIEESNLNRQLFYDYKDIGNKKVEVLLQKGQLKNKEANIKILDLKITSQNQVYNLIQNYSLVIKAIDTPDEITYWINEACVKQEIPYIAGGFLDNKGIVGPIYIPGKSEFCLDCYTIDKSTKRISKNNSGTIAPLTAIVASKISIILMKIIMDDLLEPILDKNYTYDFLINEWEVEKQQLLKESCETCGKTNQKQQNKNNILPFIGAFILSVLTSTISIITKVPFLPIGIPLYFVTFSLLTIKKRSLKEITIFAFNYTFSFIICFLIIIVIFNYKQIFPNLIITNIITTLSSLFVGGIISQIILFWISVLISIVKIKIQEVKYDSGTKY